MLIEEFCLLGGIFACVAFLVNSIFHLVTWDVALIIAFLIVIGTMFVIGPICCWVSDILLDIRYSKLKKQQKARAAADARREAEAARDERIKKNNYLDDPLLERK